MKFALILALSLSFVCAIATPVKAQNTCTIQPRNSRDFAVKNGSISTRWKYVIYRVSSSQFYLIGWAQHDTCMMFSPHGYYSTQDDALNAFREWADTNAM
jgi:ribonuclease I